MIVLLSAVLFSVRSSAYHPSILRRNSKLLSNLWYALFQLFRYGGEEGRRIGGCIETG